MWVAISKKPNTNQWDYPDTPSLFAKGFRDGSHMIVEYKGEKTAAELGVAEYAGEIPNITGIRIISPRAFYKRLPDSVKALMRTSNDNNVLNMVGEFEKASYFNLDDPDTVSGLNALVSMGAMTTQQVIEQLRDGEPNERYKGAI